MQFSIIVPVYKVENYLDKCVESVLNQTFTDFELILVDDGSPDRCPQMCDEYRKKDERVRVVHKKNGGLTSARKAGIEQAFGDYIVVVDSDDWIAEKLLEHLNEAIEKSNSDVVCYNHCLVGNTEKPCLHQYREGFYNREQIENIRCDFLYDSNDSGLCGGGLPNAIWVKCVKIDLYKACQMKVSDDIIRGEDLLFTFHLLNNCSSIYMLDYVGYYYRVNQASITHTFRENDISNLHKITRHMLDITSCEDQKFCNSVYVFALASLWSHMNVCARNSTSKSDFVNLIKKEYHVDFDKYFDKIHIFNPSRKDKFKLFLIKKHMWKIIYFIARNNLGEDEKR